MLLKLVIFRLMLVEPQL